jgi:hypothetical protein
MSDEDDVELGKTNRDQEEGEEEEDGAAAFEKKLYSSIWQIVATISAAASIGALFFTSFSAMVIVMCVFSVPSSIAVFYYQGQLENTDCKSPRPARGYPIFHMEIN